MELSDITVYTSVTDEKDTSLEHDYPIVIFSGKTAYDRFKDPRRNSRIQKILAHQYVGTYYSIYIDGNIKLLKSPKELIEEHLKDHDLAVWKHPKRDCLYDEAIVCAKRGLDDPETIIEQAKMYEDSGFAKHKGLNECGVILRRHTRKVEEFNNAWWSEYCRHSCRDQISFMYAADKVGLRFKSIDDPWLQVRDEDKAVRTSNSFEIVPHKKLNPKIQ